MSSAEGGRVKGTIKANCITKDSGAEERRETTVFARVRKYGPSPGSGLQSSFQMKAKKR